MFRNIKSSLFILCLLTALGPFSARAARLKDVGPPRDWKADLCAIYLGGEYIRTPFGTLWSEIVPNYFKTARAQGKAIAYKTPSGPLYGFHKNILHDDRVLALYEVANRYPAWALHYGIFIRENWIYLWGADLSNTILDSLTGTPFERIFRYKIKTDPRPQVLSDKGYIFVDEEGSLPRDRAEAPTVGQLLIPPSVMVRTIARVQFFEKTFDLVRFLVLGRKLLKLTDVDSEKYFKQDFLSATGLVGTLVAEEGDPTAENKLNAILLEWRRLAGPTTGIFSDLISQFESYMTDAGLSADEIAGVQAHMHEYSRTSLIPLSDLELRMDTLSMLSNLTRN
jgi:hypothetical protein